jgi:hypothetical protein
VTGIEPAISGLTERRLEVVLRFTGTLAFSLLLAFPAIAQDVDELDRHLHPNSEIGEEMPSSLYVDSERRPIVPREAARHALGHLKRHGIDSPVICETYWIAAPISAYLVDALGSVTIDEATFTTFRIVVRDGLEEVLDQRAAGDEFVFIARGVDPAGRVIWFPPPGPDHRPEEGEAFDLLLPYEFLLNREGFETLAERYPTRIGTSL